MHLIQWFDFLEKSKEVFVLDENFTQRKILPNKKFSSINNVLQ